MYEATSRPKTACRYYLQSLDRTERLGDVVGQARVWLDLGHLLKNTAVQAGRQSAATALQRRTTTGKRWCRTPTKHLNDNDDDNNNDSNILAIVPSGN